MNIATPNTAMVFDLNQIIPKCETQTAISCATISREKVQKKIVAISGRAIRF
jgi:hypothetical protein